MFLGFGHASRKGAKTLSSEEKISHSESNSPPLLQPLRLGAFAGDLPAPFFAPYAFFAAILLFGCGSGARAVTSALGR
jgi:hypothetical protein